METVNTTERLRRLRSLMAENKVDIYSTEYAPSGIHLKVPLTDGIRSRSLRGRPFFRVHCAD